MTAFPWFSRILSAQSVSKRNCCNAWLPSRVSLRLLCALLALTLLPRAARADTNPVAYKILSIGSNGTALSVQGLDDSGSSQDPKALALTVTDDTLKSSVANGFKVGDEVNLGYTAGNSGNVLNEINIWTKPSGWWPLPAILGLYFILAVCAGLFTGNDNRFDPSNWQILAWFGLVLSAYIAALIIRFHNFGLIGGVDIPENLVLLAGLSAASFSLAMSQNKPAGADGSTNRAVKPVLSNLITDDAPTYVDDALAKAAALQQAATLYDLASADLKTAEDKLKDANRGISEPAKALAKAGFETAQLVADNASGNLKLAQTASERANALAKAAPTGSAPAGGGNVELAKFQMVCITIIALCVYLVQACNFLVLMEARNIVSLPDLDSTLLALFGISHGAYIVNGTTNNPNKPS